MFLTYTHFRTKGSWSQQVSSKPQDTLRGLPGSEVHNGALEFFVYFKKGCQCFDASLAGSIVEVVLLLRRKEHPPLLRPLAAHGHSNGLLTPRHICVNLHGPDYPNFWPWLGRPQLITMHQSQEPEPAGNDLSGPPAVVAPPSLERHRNTFQIQRYA